MSLHDKVSGAGRERVLIAAQECRCARLFDRGGGGERATRLKLVDQVGIRGIDRSPRHVENA